MKTKSRRYQVFLVCLFSYGFISSTLFGFDTPNRFSALQEKEVEIKPSNFKAKAMCEDFSASVLTVSNVSCPQIMDGKLLIQSTGGIAPYTYQWRALSGGSVSSTSSQTAEYTIEQLGTGFYNITVIDGANCSLSFPGQIFGAASMILSGNVTSNYNGAQISCFGAKDGRIELIVSGGTLPFMYTWNGETTPSGPNFDSVGAGTYGFTVTDGCDSRETLSIEVKEPAEYISPVALLLFLYSE